MSSARSRRQALHRLGIVAKVLSLAAVLHVLVLPQLGGTRKAIGLLSTVNPLLIVAAVLLEGMALVAYAQLSRSLLRAEERLPLWVSFRVVLASLAVNHVVPGGAAAAGALQYRLLTRGGLASSDAGFVMAAQSIGSALVLNVLLWIALIWSIPARGFQPAYALAAAVGAVLLGAVGAAVLALTRGRVRSVKVLARLAGRLPRIDEGRVAAGLGRAAGQLGSLMAEPRRAAALLAWAAANWLLDAAVLGVFLAAFGHRTGIPGLLVAYGLANVLAAIPLTPGGLGIVEATLIVTLAGFGTPRAEAGLAVTAYRLVQFWLPIPLGGVAWASLTGRRRRGAVGAMAQQAQAANA